jgi:hypothetical protein
MISIEVIPKVNIFPVGDTPLNTSTPVCSGAKPAARVTDKKVIVLTTWDFGTPESRTDLEGLRCWNRQHRMRKRRFELVENRLAKAGWNVPNDAGDCTADGILGIFGTNNSLEEREGD